MLITFLTFLKLWLDASFSIDQESCDLFVILYKCWSHNPVATVALCLLTQSYQQASTLIRHL